jgi:tetratricopeptide (TPR) repeat protein
VKSLIWVVALATGAVSPAVAQLAVQRPTEKLLIVPLPVDTGADSLTSVRVSDVARERVERLARYKVLVIPKDKICEALAASGFACHGLMDAHQTRQLARFLDADAFMTGTIGREAGVLAAKIRVIDVGGSGFASAFEIRDANPGSAEALGEAVAQRLNTVIRAGERARECEEQRRQGRFSRALDAARKALETEPNLPAAYLCIATTYEAQRLGPDSIIAAATRALQGDSLNTHALETIARNYQVKGDTAQALATFERLWYADPNNKAILLGVVTQLQLRKDFEGAERLLRAGLERFPGDPQLNDRLYQMCIEGGRWQCVLDVVNARIERDTTLLADTATLKVAIGAAQQIPDTTSLCRYTEAAVSRYPTDVSFIKTRGACFELRGQTDSAVALFERAFHADTTDVANALLVAKTLVESAGWDTTGTGRDTSVLAPRRAALAQQMERARPFIKRGLVARDTALRINSAALMFQAGAKLAQAGAYDRAYPWLDTLLQTLDKGTVPPGPGIDQIRTNANFWYGISSVVTAPPAYKSMTDAKSCAQAKAFNDRIKRTRSALESSRTVHPPTVTRMLGAVGQYENAMKSVKQAFRCSNF